MCPDRESNPNTLVCGTTLQPAEPPARADQSFSELRLFVGFHGDTLNSHVFVVAFNSYLLKCLVPKRRKREKNSKLGTCPGAISEVTSARGGGGNDGNQHRWDQTQQNRIRTQTSRVGGGPHSPAWILRVECRPPQGPEDGGWVAAPVPTAEMDPN